MLPLPTSSPPFSTSLSAGLKCMGATRKGRDTQSNTSAYIFNYISKFENEVTQLAEPTEQEIRQMRGGNQRSQKGKEPRLPPTVSSRPRGTGRLLLRSYFSITAAQKHPRQAAQTDTCRQFAFIRGLTVKSRRKHLKNAPIV